MDKVQNFKLGEDGYGLLVAKDGTFIVTPNKDDIMKKKISESDDPAVRALGEKMLSGDSGYVRYKSASGDNMIAFYNPIKATGWGMATVAYESELFAPVRNALKIMIVISVILLIAISFAVMMTVNRVMAPLSIMMNEMHLLSQGDFRKRETNIDSDNELGLLADVVDEMRSAVNSVMNSVKGSAQNLLESADELNATTEQSALAANQVAESIVKVAEGTNEQLGAVTGTQEAVDHLSQTIQHVSEQADSAASHSKEAADIAKQGGVTIENAITQIKEIETSTIESTKVVTSLGERSTEIGEIVGTISGIADQTNLLALNAAIEAARAGEAGRGFAVVADEVRKLAESSREAAQRISALIEQTQQDTERAVAGMQRGSEQVQVGSQSIIEMGDSFRKIIDIVDDISRQSQEISDATRDLTSNGDEIVGHIRTIGSASKQAAEEAETVSAATEEQSAGVHEIATASQGLAKMASDLQKEIEKFKV